MSTSAIGAVLDAIQAGLSAEFATVNIFTGPVSREEAGLECIVFGDCRLTEERGAMGGTKLEMWDVDGVVYTASDKHWVGSTEETIRASRDRTLALFATVETYLNDTYTGALPDVEITAAEMQEGYDPEGRWCALTFTLEVKATKNP
jgi:hypothetical protein